MAEIKKAKRCSNCKFFRRQGLHLDGRCYDYCKKIKVPVRVLGICDLFLMTGDEARENEIKNKYNYKDGECLK